LCKVTHLSVRLCWHDSGWNGIGKDVELQTNSKTDFIVRASMAQRKGVTKEVIVFLRREVNGEMKECSRCYPNDWGIAL